MPARSNRAAAIAASALIWMLLGMPMAQAATVTVATAGDIAKVFPGTQQTKTANLISGMGASKVLVLGDAQYEQGEYENFLRSYDPTWGVFNNIAAPVPGNHEYLTPNAAGYFQYFANVLSPYGATATDPTKAYYSFNVGDWHVVAMNSNCGVDGVSCSQQRAWLRADLEADTHLCEIVFAHHPSQQGFANTAATYGADLLLAGHKHVYERWDHKFGLDIRQLIVGTGGRSLGTPADNADAAVKAFGVAKLTLRAERYAWQFIDIAGAVRDSGSDTCRS
jgi:acid phosphatase type 7